MSLTDIGLLTEIICALTKCWADVWCYAVLCCVQEQVGPYVHRVYHEKLDVLWDADGRVYFKVQTGSRVDTAWLLVPVCHSVSGVNFVVFV